MVFSGCCVEHEHSPGCGQSTNFLQLGKEVLVPPSLKTFRNRLDGALSSLIWLKMSPLTAGGWKAFKGPFQPEIFPVTCPVLLLLLLLSWQVLTRPAPPLSPSPPSAHCGWMRKEVGRDSVLFQGCWCSIILWGCPRG